MLTKAGISVVMEENNKGVLRPVIHGDVDPALMAQPGSAAWYTPVPGGLGPMTVACLIANLCLAYRKQAGTGNKARSRL